MGKFSEALHPRGHGGKFSKKGSGAKGSAVKKATTSGGFNRKERNERAKMVSSKVREAGYSKGTAKAVGRTSKAIDKGKLTWDQNGNMARTARRKDRKVVAAHNRRTLEAAGAKMAKRSTSGGSKKKK